MGIVATGDQNIWEDFQVADNTEHITKNGGDFIVEIVKGVLRKDVLRSEFRTKILGKKVYQIKLAYTFTILTDERGKGEAVTTQLWDGGSPSNSLRWDYDRNVLFYRLYNDATRGKENKDLTELKKGQGVRIGFVINAREDDSGWIQIYVDGKKMVDRKGQNLFGKLDKDPYIKMGLYDDDDLPSGMSNRKVKFSDIIIGDENTSLEELRLGGTDMDEPEVDEPEVDEPEVDEPEVDEPEVDEPEVDEPTKPEEPRLDIRDMQKCVDNINYWFNRLKRNLDK